MILLCRLVSESGKQTPIETRIFVVPSLHCSTGSESSPAADAAELWSQSLNQVKNLRLGLEKELLEHEKYCSQRGM